MRRGVILSSVGHGVVLAALVFGLPNFIEPPTTTLVPIEILPLEEIEEAKPEPKPAPETTAEKVAPKPPPPAEQAKPPPPPEPPKPEPLPEPPIKEAKAVEEPPPPAVEPEPEPIKPPPPPRKRPEFTEPPKKAEPKPDRLASILRNVERALKKPPEAPQEKKPEAPVEGPVSRQVSVLEQNEMVRAIQQQLFSCWRLDPGAAAAEDMVVHIRVTLNPDGSLRRAQVVDVARMATDSYFRSAAENATRAIHKCSPFRLPPNKYDIWRDLTLRFNPREMFGT